MLTLGEARGEGETTQQVCSGSHFLESKETDQGCTPKLDSDLLAAYKSLSGWACPTHPWMRARLHQCLPALCLSRAPGKQPSAMWSLGSCQHFGVLNKNMLYSKKCSFI